MKLDPANTQAKSGLSAVKRAIDAEAKEDGGKGIGGLGNMFNDPQLIQKLSANPKTRNLLADPQFMAKLQKLKENPSSVGDALGDPRFISVMGVLLGIDMSGDMGFKPPSTSEHEEDIPMPDARLPSENAEPTLRTAEPEPVIESEPEDEETASRRKAKDEADAEKKLGTENYKKRQFDAAIEHYSKAWDLHKDITYLTNRSAAKFEKGDFEGSIDDCKKAIEEGREVLADFKIIAKYVRPIFSCQKFWLM